MAATDKPFNNQRTLDIVFAVSNILMLLSVVWMMVQDFSREYKTEQRAFREVESNLAVRLALQNLPDPDEFDKAEKAVEATRPSEAQITEVKEAKKTLAELQPDKEKAEARFQAVQAELSSKVSFRDIALEHADTPEKTKDVTAQYDKILADLNSQFDKAQADRDKIVTKMKLEQQKLERIEAPHTKAVAEFKKVNDKIDAQIKLAIAKRWGFGDWLRSQWMIEAFASPTKIHQFTINDIPIDYNFKQVTRFDRCMSCHVGITDSRFSKENLEGLTKDDPNAEKMKKARDFYDRRVKALGNSPDIAMIPNPYHVESTKLSESLLTKSRISEFAAHPRLDLFVGANSKHPAEKFGCTACHSGQGSGTSFNDASHSPNSMAAQKDWTKKNGWEFNHMWDFPMHSKRFVEASCVKCHHEVTDLVSRDGRVEAPKLMRGFNLIKENGCFGCHEISGWKSGQRIGPDLRVEPSPPLEYPMSPAEITRAQEDTDNRPGTMRKVGPSLARVKEKVSTGWIEKWLASPSSFRPDTKMPHYYGLSTNNVDALPDDQKRFPDTEMASIAHFLTKTSENYLADAAKVRKDSAEAVRAEEDELTALINKGRLDEKEQTRLNELKWKRQLRTVAPLVDLAKDIKEDKETLTRGRNLFIERGCLACHTHHGTESAGKNSPAISSEAMFGPNLTQIAEKFENKAQARKWLVQWIINPQLHSPRSRMPVTHLEPKEAADIAAWLLAQPSGRDADNPWHKMAVKQPTKEELQNLVRVYLVRMLSKRDIESYLKGEFKDGADWDVVKADLTKDEVALRDKVNNEDDLKFYLGKKAVTRLGCFGCHDIPGFENTKSIGVGLNDWGKKPADRLAFEDIDNFFKKHYHTVDSLVDDNGKPVAAKDKDGKEPYESFFAEALTGHHRQRDGYLNQKLREPRSYDFNRIRTWDDRSRMPKFTFARPRKKDDEKEDDFKARIMKDEAEAREAVATFVLGLTAEQVPTKSINQPTGDRMAEVKGRQILDKCNCASCHLIRPGVYDFKTSPKTIQGLDSKFESIADLIKNEIIHPNHHNWVGRNPLGADPLTAYGVPKIDEGELVLTLAEALRFTGKSKTIRNVQSGFDVRIPIEDVVGSAGIKSQEDFDRRFQASAPYGGTFADLMVPWLTSKQQPSDYRTKYKEEKEARHALPPTLFAQGERTQTEWLYKFLRDPERVRQLTILRMPKFNMSKDEAEGLVKYFAAVSRLNNPGIGLTYPHEVIPARDELSSKYWRDKTAEYVKRLQSEKDKDGKSLYDTRLAAYQKIWEMVRADEEPALKSSLKQQNNRIEVKKKDKQAAEKKKADETDPAKKAELDKDIAVLAGDIEIAQQRKSEIEQTLAGLDEKTQEKTWATQEAYASDAYRLLTSRDLCTKCHQVGTIKAAEPASQGPPLDKAFLRLRPGWVERWVDQPQRFLPYPSLMPVYFERGQPKHQNLHAGPAREQIEALRDVLMNFDRVSQLSVNKTRDPSPPAGK